MERESKEGEKEGGGGEKCKGEKRETRTAVFTH